MPEAFLASPALKHAFPLPMENGCYAIGDLVLRLDKTLGLVYDTSDARKESA
jgi:hypothetical protein